MNTPLFLLFVISKIGLSHSTQYEYLFDLRNESIDYNSTCNSEITIDFSAHNLSKIEKSLLSNPTITCLNLSKNGIQSIDENAFANIPNLRYLNLAGNPLHLNDTFSNSFKNLETLILDDSSSVNTNAFPFNDHVYIIHLHTEYPELKKLYIRDTKYPLIIYANPRTFPKLTHLDLSGSSVFYDYFDWLPNSLEYLDLSGNELLGLTLKDLKSLKWLRVDNGNSLLNVELKNLTSLQQLSISSNKIKGISHTKFVNIYSLLFLDLSNNSIAHIDTSSFDTMKKLIRLNLSKNYITDIRTVFDRLGDLQLLDLKENLISELPTFTNEMKLEILLLNCNKLTNIERGAFSKMPKLEILNLDNNKISHIDAEAFSDLENLKTLTLSNNMITSLPVNWILPMIRIENLHISGNNFEVFENLALSKNTPLKNLYLSKQFKYLQLTSLKMVNENLTISIDPDYEFIEKCVVPNERASPIYG